MLFARRKQYFARIFNSTFMERCHCMKQIILPITVHLNIRLPLALLRPEPADAPTGPEPEAHACQGCGNCGGCGKCRHEKNRAASCPVVSASVSGRPRNSARPTRNGSAAWSVSSAETPGPAGPLSVRLHLRQQQRPKFPDEQGPRLCGELLQDTARRNGKRKRQ